jgi:hypothetical protein
MIEPYELRQLAENRYVIISPEQAIEIADHIDISKKGAPHRQKDMQQQLQKIPLAATPTRTGEARMTPSEYRKNLDLDTGIAYEAARQHIDGAIHELEIAVELCELSGKWNTDLVQEVITELQRHKVALQGFGERKGK